MDKPRAEKVSVVDEVRERLDAAAGSVVTEYRGLSVGEMAELRRTLVAAGGDYKVYKNTLVRRAVVGGAHQPLEEFLTGPTALAFVHGDVSAVAKALRDFSRGNPALQIKGGLVDGGVLSPSQLQVLADLPSRDVMLGMMAGAIAAPLRQLAGLLQAVPRNLAYGLAALVDQRRGEADAQPVPAAEADGGAEAAAEAEPGGDQPKDTETTETETSQTETQRKEEV